MLNWNATVTTFLTPSADEAKRGAEAWLVASLQNIIEKVKGV